MCIQVIVSEAGRIQGDEEQERFLDPRSKATFVFDHLRLVCDHVYLNLVYVRLSVSWQEASDAQPYEVDEEAETFRCIHIPFFALIHAKILCWLSSALEAATIAYLADHFHSGVTSVFAVPGSSSKFIIQIVANKYNPQNYWYVLHSGWYNSILNVYQVWKMAV